MNEISENIKVSESQVSYNGRRELQLWKEKKNPLCGGRLELDVSVWEENINIYKNVDRALVAQTVKRLPVMRETWVRSLGRENPLEKEMATHSQYSCLENSMDGAW